MIHRLDPDHFRLERMIVLMHVSEELELRRRRPHDQ
jgi:hypothetical protein